MKQRTMKPVKTWIVILLLLSTIMLSFTLPRARYVGTGFISSLEIPYLISDWHGKNITEKLNLDFEKDWNKFISEALAYEYVNKKGEKILFIILDAGNFHHPNVCFTSAGFSIKELDDIKFHVLDRTFNVHSVYTERGTESFLSFYWISIDKKIVHEWVEQKMKQLYFSLFNKKRVGLMVRIDIPAKEEDIENALIVARQFIRDLGYSLPPEKVEYLFGENK